jgi:hypothetical protein
VRFDASLERGMPWEFKPMQREMTCASAKRAWPSTRPTTPPTAPVAGTASYNVTPDSAGGYFTKIDCFCFPMQVLQPGERVQMPVTFFVDPASSPTAKASSSRRSRCPTPSTNRPTCPKSRRLALPPAPDTNSGQLSAKNEGTPMAHAKNHDYHILPPSIWPFIGRSAAFVMLFGAVLWMHGSGPWLFLIGLVGVLYVMFAWWADVVKESQAGDHTPVVRIGLRYGFILFIMSEVMFFAAWFWSFFKHAMYPMGPMSAHRRRRLAARRDRDLRPLAPAADQHADPAVLGRRRHLGAPRAGA